MGYNGIVKMELMNRYEVPYHWHTVVLHEWKAHHITWLNELELIWQTDYYITDQDEPVNVARKSIRKVYFLFEDPKHATMFALRWAF